MLSNCAKLNDCSTLCGTCAWQVHSGFAPRMCMQVQVFVCYTVEFVQFSELLQNAAQVATRTPLQYTCTWPCW
jgi:hypothetical protein